MASKLLKPTIAVLGASKTGKTSYIRHCIKGEQIIRPEYTPTDFTEITKTRVTTNIGVINLDMIDFTGNLKYIHFMATQLVRCDGAIALVDPLRPGSFEETRTILNYVHGYIKDIKFVPTATFFSKCDKYDFIPSDVGVNHFSAYCGINTNLPLEIVLSKIFREKIKIT